MRIDITVSDFAYRQYMEYIARSWAGHTISAPDAVAAFIADHGGIKR